MADNLNINIRAKLDKQASGQQIKADVTQLEKTPFFIRLVGKLHKALTKANIESDIKQLEKSVGSVRLNGRLNRNTTRQNIRSDIQNVARGNTVTFDARIDEQALETSVENARNTIEQNLNSNPINVPINADTNIDNCTDDMRTFNNVTRETRGILADYLNVRDIFREISNAIKKAIDNVEKLNKAETDLMIATQKSASEMKSLMIDYNNLAKDMSSTTIDVTGAADDFLRQGQSVADTNTLIRDSLILSKIGQIESAEATQYLTSSMKGYQVEAKNVIDIVDKLSAVDLQSASNSGELAEAMSRCANVARTSGVELDTLIAYLAVTKDVTQDSASAIGNAWKSTFTRLNNIKIGKFLDEDGNDISGEINDAERVLSKFNISLRDNAKEFRDAQDVIADVANAWENMTSVEQAAVRKGFVNTFQAEKFTALMENYHRVLELTEVSANSVGVSMEKFAIYEQSLEASTNRLTASLEGLAYNTISADFIKGLADGATAIVSFVDNTKLLKTGITAGVFTGLISGVMALGTRMVALRNNVVQFTQAMNISRQTSALNATQFQVLRASVVGLTEAQLRLVLSSNNLTETQRLELMQSAGIEQARQRQLLQTWNLTTATQAQTTATFSLRGAWEALKLSILNNPIGLLVGALTLATTVTSSLIQRQKELREEATETGNTYKELTESMKDVVSQYEAILDSDKSAIEKTEELNAWKRELIDTYGFEKEKLKELNEERAEGIALLEEEIKKATQRDAAEWLGTYDKQFEDAKKAINTDKNLEFSISDMANVGLEANFDWSELDDRLLKYINIDNIQTTDSRSANSITKTQITDFSIAGDNLIEQYEAMQEMITILGGITKRSREEQALLDELNRQSDKIKKKLDKHQSNYELGYSNEATIHFSDYINNGNELENVGQDSYTAWRDGLLKMANGDRVLEQELLKLAEKQFPDYAEYFNNLTLAHQMFPDYKGTDKSDFLNFLSPEDLEIAIQIPDLFIDGIEGAYKKIEKFKYENPVGVTIDKASFEELQEKYEALSKSVSDFTSHTKTFNSALNEQQEYGQLSADTIQELIEAGYAQALVTDKETGAVTLNVDAYNSLNAEKKKQIQLDIAKLELDLINPYKEEALAIADLKNSLAILNAEERKATQIKIAQMEASLASMKLSEEETKQKEQELARLKALMSSLDAPTFDSKSGGKKDTATENVANDYLSNRIEELEAKIEITLDTSKADDGTKLNIEEKFDYVKSIYDEILFEIDSRINELVQQGTEENADAIKKLEKQYEEYAKKKADIFDDEIDNEINHINYLKKRTDSYYNDKIDKIQSEKSAMEERYDAEINKIDEQIDALQKSNDEKQKEYDIEKARQELEKSQQRTRKTYGADGNVAYRQDDEAVAEAKQNLDDLLLEQTIENLEAQKVVLETAKENEFEQFKTQIEALQKQQETQDNIYSTLLEILETYKKPSVVESNANVWDTIYKDAENVQPDSDSVNIKGVDIDTTPIKENIVTQIDIVEWLERLGANPAIVNSYKNNIPNVTTAKLTDSINANANKQWNEQHKPEWSASRDDYKINNQSQIINNTIGDVHVHNPVKDGKDVANEVLTELTLALERQMYTNIKRY